MIGNQIGATERRNAPAWVLAWICNNHRQTNFRAAQPGPLKQTYWLVPHDNPANDTDLHAVADGLMAQPVLHPIPRRQDGALASTGSLLKTQLGAARLVGIKEADTSEEVIVRVQNTTKQQTAVVLGSDVFQFEKAWKSDAIERTVKKLDVVAGSVTMTMDPLTIATIKLA